MKKHPSESESSGSGEGTPDCAGTLLLVVPRGGRFAVKRIVIPGDPVIRAVPRAEAVRAIVLEDEGVPAGDASRREFLVDNEGLPHPATGCARAFVGRDLVRRAHAGAGGSHDGAESSAFARPKGARRMPAS